MTTRSKLALVLALLPACGARSSLVEGKPLQDGGVPPPGECTPLTPHGDVVTLASSAEARVLEPTLIRSADDGDSLTLFTKRSTGVGSSPRGSLNYATWRGLADWPPSFSDELVFQETFFDKQLATAAGNRVSLFLRAEGAMGGGASPLAEMYPRFDPVSGDLGPTGSFFGGALLFISPGETRTLVGFRGGNGGEAVVAGLSGSGAQAGELVKSISMGCAEGKPLGVAERVENTWIVGFSSGILVNNLSCGNGANPPTELSFARIDAGLSLYAGPVFGGAIIDSLAGAVLGDGALFAWRRQGASEPLMAARFDVSGALTVEPKPLSEATPAKGTLGATAIGNLVALAWKDAQNPKQIGVILVDGQGNVKAERAFQTEGEVASTLTLAGSADGDALYVSWSEGSREAVKLMRLDCIADED